MNHETCDVVVIGAGLVGAAIAFDLARTGAGVMLFEAESELAAGASRSNSGVLHTGFDSTPDTLETRLIRAQAARWPAIFEALGVPHRVPGALLLARSDKEQGKLETIAVKAAHNGVEVELVGQIRVRELEPNAPAIAGLLVPNEAMTDPYEVVRRLVVGLDVRLGCRVVSLEPDGQGVRVDWTSGEERGSIRARFAVNCAGLFADELSNGEFEITARRGEFIVYPHGTANLVNHTLLPVPNDFTKGVLVFPTLYGHLCVGPTAEDQPDKCDWTPHADALEVLRRKAAEVVPRLAALEPVNAWAGLRTVGHPRNYLIEFSGRIPALLHVAGIRSTGLSACLGISEYAVGLLEERGLERSSARAMPSISTVPSESARPWWERLNALRGVDSARVR